MPLKRLARWHGWGWLAGGIGCGTLIGLSIPPFGWWPLAWLGFAGLALLLPGRPWRTRAAIGLGAGVGQYVLGLWWVHEFSIPGWIALLAFSALFTTLAVALTPGARRMSVAAALPALMVLADWGRDHIPLGGFPLGGVSLGQAASPLAPSLRLGGSLILTGVTVLAGVAIAEVVQAVRSWRAARSPWSNGRKARRDATLTTGGAVGLAGLVVALVAVASASPSGSGGQFAPLRVALVQGGGPRGTRAIYTNPEVVFRRHLAASSLLDQPVDLIVWPEGVLQSHVAYTTTSDAAAIAALARSTGATVVVGVEQDVGSHNYVNEVVAWGPDGRIVASYQKNHLVPFGEYVPARHLVNKFFNIADVPFDAIAGHSPGLLPTPVSPLGVMISYEVFFDGRARSAVRAGGEVLIVPTNTASYRSTQVPTQEVAAARLRAWETGRWTLQVTPTGYTAVINPRGRIVQRTTLDEQKVLVASVPRLDGRTVYVRWGDYPVVIAAALTALVAWLLGRARHRRQKDRWSLGS